MRQTTITKTRRPPRRRADPLLCWRAGFMGLRPTDMFFAPLFRVPDGVRSLHFLTRFWFDDLEGGVELVHQAQQLGHLGRVSLDLDFSCLRRSGEVPLV